MDGRELALALGPGPVRQDVGHGMLGPPSCLVKIEAVLLESRQVDDPEVRTSRGVKGGWLSQVIPAGPDEFTADEAVFVVRREFFVWTIGPVCEVHVVRADR